MIAVRTQSNKLTRILMYVSLVSPPLTNSAGVVGVLSIRGREESAELALSDRFTAPGSQDQQIWSRPGDTPILQTQRLVIPQPVSAAPGQGTTNNTQTG